MAYVLVKSGVVVQKQIDQQNGFINAPDNVICGWLYDGAKFSAPTPPASNVKTRISKYDLITRLTDAEADMLLADFNDAPGKLALLWNSIMYVDQTDPSYPILQSIIVNRLGEARAAEVLAPME